MPDSRTRTARLLLASGCAVCMAVATPLAAQVKGSVVNGTTGSPEAGVTLTLSSFLGGMTPLEESLSGADGRFAFTKQLPTVSRDQPFAGAIRAEFEGIGYTEILRAESLGQDVQVTVYSTNASDLPTPGRVVIFEPNGGELLVHELYQYFNESSPPVTYSSEDGTLRFYLPEAAEGDVEVSGRGPANMPLRSTALPTGEPGLYKVDFPLKPGTNTINVSYTLPYTDGMQLTVRSAYPDSITRVGAPQGVEVAGPGVTPAGQEPTTQLQAFILPDVPEITLTISGEGRLRSASSASSSGQSDISIEQAPIASELAWILVLAVLIFCIGFFHLLGSKLPDGHAAPRREKG